MKLTRRGEPGREVPVVEIDGTAWDATPVGDFGPGFWADGGPQRLRELAASGGLRPWTGGQVRYGSPVRELGPTKCVTSDGSTSASSSADRIALRIISTMADTDAAVWPDSARA